MALSDWTIKDMPVKCQQFTTYTRFNPHITDFEYIGSNTSIRAKVSGQAEDDMFSVCGINLAKFIYSASTKFDCFDNYGHWEMEITCTSEGAVLPMFVKIKDEPERIEYVVG